jgi:PST family polysaccharide transporter
MARLSMTAVNCANVRYPILVLMKVFETIRRRAGVRESLANIGWLSSDRFLRMFGAVIVGTLVARYLGPSQFGLLNYALAVFGFFNILSNLGLDSLIVRDLALDHAAEPVTLGSGFVLKAFAGVATAIAAVITTRLLEPKNAALLKIVEIISLGSLFQAVDVIDYFFQAQTKSRYSVVPRSIAFISASLARLAAIFLHAALLTFVWISALEVITGEIGLVISYLRFRRSMRMWTWSLSRAKALLAQSWPLLMSGLMIMVYMRSDQVLLGKLASKTAVGQYSAAIRLSEIWYAIPMIVCASVMPKILMSRDRDLSRYYARLQRLYEVMILISAAVALATQVAGPFVIWLLYGPQYSAAAGILSIHIWTGVFVFVGVVSGSQLVQENLTVSVLQRTFLGAILNIVLNLFWIPRWGGMGSAMATLIAQSFAGYFADLLDARTRHIFRMKTQAWLNFLLLPQRIFSAAQE